MVQLKLCGINSKNNFIIHSSGNFKIKTSSQFLIINYVRVLLYCLMILVIQINGKTSTIELNLEI